MKFWRAGPHVISKIEATWLGRDGNQEERVFFFQKKILHWFVIDLHSTCGVRSEGKSPPRNPENHIFPTFSFPLQFPECHEKSSMEVRYNGLRNWRLQWRRWPKLSPSLSTGEAIFFPSANSTILYVLMACLHPSVPNLQFTSVGLLGSKSATTNALLNFLFFCTLKYFPCFFLVPIFHCDWFVLVLRMWNS